MNAGKLEIDLEANTKSFDYQIEQAEEKLNDLLADYELLSQEKGFNEQGVQAKLMRNEIEKASNSLKRLQQQQEKQNEVSSKGFSLNLKGMKRLALGIIGVSSVYNLARKASGAYLSQDTELAQKLQSVWVGLGSFLAPLLEKISDLTLKAVGYLNVFVKALTGVDYIARANAKALDKQAKAQKNLNKATQQYDFDVIRTQQENASAGGGLETGSLINIPQLDEGIVKKLQNLAAWLVKNKEYVEAFGITLGIVFGVSAISKLSKNIAGLIGTAGTKGVVGTGLAGLGALLLFMADVFVISLVLKGYDKIREQLVDLEEHLKKNTEGQKGVTDATQKTIDTFKEAEEQGKLTTEIIEGYSKSLEKNRESALRQIAKLEEQKTLTGIFTGKNKELTKQQKELTKQYELASNELQRMADEGYVADQKFGSLKDTLNKLTMKQWEINVVLKYLDPKGTLYTDINKSGKTVVKGYALGGIVTQPTRALIGEAGYPEAVVPMTQDYLSTLAQEIARFGGSGNGSQPINIYLDGRLIQRQNARVEKDLKFRTNS